MRTQCIYLSVSACVCSKANAKRWEEECLQLRRGHSPRSTAEQEELQRLREENASMKKEVCPTLTLCCVDTPNSTSTSVTVPVTISVTVPVPVTTTVNCPCHSHLQLAAGGGAGRVEELEAGNRSLKEQVHQLEERISKLQMVSGVGWGGVEWVGPSGCVMLLLVLAGAGGGEAEGSRSSAGPAGESSDICCTTCSLSQLTPTPADPDRGVPDPLGESGSHVERAVDGQGCPSYPPAGSSLQTEQHGRSPLPAGGAQPAAWQGRRGLATPHTILITQTVLSHAAVT